jgi:DNA-binding beta-propeller fold protein YncE
MNRVHASWALLVMVAWASGCVEPLTVARQDDGHGEADRADGGADADADAEDIVREIPEVVEEVTSRGSMGPGTDHPFEPGPENADGVDTDVEGNLTLTWESMRLRYMWVANSGEGTVSKIDIIADPPMEVARYATGMSDMLADPSRTSVDLAGDVFVGNRAGWYPAPSHSWDSSLTKIAAETARCVDRDGDRTIDTATGTAPLARSDGTGGVPAGQSTDECVLWTRDFRPESRRATDRAEPHGCLGLRAVAATNETGLDFEANGHVWVGCMDDRKVYKLHGTTGDLLAYADVSPCMPYGFLMGVLDREVLWIACRTSEDWPAEGIAALDTRTMAVTMLPAGMGNPYGFAMNSTGDVWVATMGRSTSAVWRYSTAAGWQGLAGRSDLMRGIAVDADGYAWAMNTSPAPNPPEVWLIDPATFPAGSSLLEVLPVTDNQTLHPARTGSGVAIDLDGNVYAISMGDGDVYEPDPGWVTKFTVDRSGGRPVVDLAGHPERRVQFHIGANPYTYSDMIGYHLRRFSAREGWYRQVFEACDPNYQVRWDWITWNASVPAGTRMLIRARTSNYVDRLPESTWVRLVDVPDDVAPVAIPTDLPEGHFIEIEVRLYADASLVFSPVVRQVEFEFACTVPFI